MQKSTKEMVFRLYNQDSDQRTYILNPEGKLGVGPKESVVNEICSLAALRFPQNQSQSLIDHILKSYLSSYISYRHINGAPDAISLQVYEGGTDFLLTLDAKEAGKTNECTTVYVGLKDDSVELKSWNTEYLNHLYNSSSTGEFVATGFKGELFNKTVLTPYSDGLRVSSCAAKVSPTAFTVDVADTAIGQDYTTNCNFEHISIGCDEYSLDTHKIDEAVSQARIILDNFIKGELPVEQINMGEQTQG